MNPVQHLLLLATFMMSLSVNASLVRMDYSGVVTTATGVFSDESVVNNFVSGAFFIDTESIPILPPTSVTAQYNPGLNLIEEINVSAISYRETIFF